MYIDPFWAGVVATVALEAVVVILAAVIAVYKDSKKNK